MFRSVALKVRQSPTQSSNDKAVIVILLESADMICFIFAYTVILSSVLKTTDDDNLWCLINERG